jgi:hypothetical protein
MTVGWMTFKKSSTILPYRPVPGLSLRDVNLIRRAFYAMGKRGEQSKREAKERGI